MASKQRPVKLTTPSRCQQSVLPFSAGLKIRLPSFNQSQPYSEYSEAQVLSCLSRPLKIGSII
jgi:hypothetical protein